MRRDHQARRSAHAAPQPFDCLLRQALRRDSKRRQRALEVERLGGGEQRNHVAAVATADPRVKTSRPAIVVAWKSLACTTVEDELKAAFEHRFFGRE